MDVVEAISHGHDFTISEEDIMLSLEEYHEKYGCLICGSRTKSCTPNKCQYDRLNDERD